MPGAPTRTRPRRGSSSATPSKISLSISLSPKCRGSVVVLLCSEAGPTLARAHGATLAETWKGEEPVMQACCWPYFFFSCCWP